MSCSPNVSPSLKLGPAADHERQGLDPVTVESFAELDEVLENRSNNPLHLKLSTVQNVAWFVRPKDGKLVKKCNGEELKTILRFRVDNCRPMLSVISTPAEKSESVPEIMPDDPAESDDEAVGQGFEATSVGHQNAERQSVEGHFSAMALGGGGSRKEACAIKAYDLSHYPDVSKVFDVESGLNNLHRSAKAEIGLTIRHGSTPVLLNIYHDEDFANVRVYTDTPAWGQDSATCIRENVTRLLVCGDAQTANKLNTFFRFIIEKFKRLDLNPAIVANPSFKRIKVRDGTFVEGGPKWKTIGFQTMKSFDVISHWAIIQKLTFDDQQRFTNASIESLEQQAHNLHIASIRSTFKDELGNDSEAEAFIKLTRNEDDDRTFHPREGTIFKLSFSRAVHDEDTQIKKDVKRFTFRVGKPLPFAPAGTISGTLIRPYYSDTCKFDPEDLQTFKIAEYNSPAEAKIRAAQDPGNLCYVRVLTHNRWAKTVSNSFNRVINDKTDKPFTEYNQHVHGILVAKSVHNLEDLDFFAIPKQILNISGVLHLMEVDSTQAQVVEGMSTGPIDITQGPPGTGKTYTVGQTFVPFAYLPTSGHTFLVVSPSNRGCDDVATKLEEICDGLRQKARNDPEFAKKYPHLLRPDFYGVRAFSKTAEKTWRDAVIQLNHEKPENSRPTTILPEDEITQELNQVEKLLTARIKENHQQVFPGVYDKRLKQYENSISAKMYQSVGLWPGYDAWPGYPTKFATFLAKTLNKIRAPKDMTLEESQELDKDAALLFKDIVQNARYIVGTTAAVSSPVMIDAMIDTVTVITLDENVREAEYNLAPLLAANFTQKVKFHLLGDQSQMEPHSALTIRQSPTAAQVAMPLMTRLIRSGFPFVMLTSNRRAHPEIAALYSSIQYDNQLVSNPLLAERPGSTMIVVMHGSSDARKKFCPIILYDIQGLPNNKAANNDQGQGQKSKKIAVPFKVTVGPSGSKSCLFSAQLTINLAVWYIKALMQDSTMPQEFKVACLTVYSDQTNLHEAAKQRMLMDNEGKNIADHLECLTVDSSQGLEFDFVIFDLVVDSKLGSISENGRALVAFSRAKLGLAVIGSTAAIRNTRTRGGEFVRKAVQYMKDNCTHKNVDPKNLRGCKWLPASENAS